MFKTFNQNQKGYAILFTVIIVSAISVIAAGITNAIYKQIVLSSLSRDSQTAFYMADTASDCALLFDMEVKDTIPDFLNLESYSWNCGGFDMTVDPSIDGSYDIEPSGSVGEGQGPCYRVQTTKNDPSTTIIANGYNICNKDNIRTVERQIKIVYE